MQKLDKSGIRPGITLTVWKKLEEHNPDFFATYRVRLQLLAQIQEFNKIVRRCGGLHACLASVLTRACGVWAQVEQQAKATGVGTQHAADAAAAMAAATPTHVPPYTPAGSVASGRSGAAVSVSSESTATRSRRGSGAPSATAAAAAAAAAAYASNSGAVAPMPAAVASTRTFLQGLQAAASRGGLQHHTQQQQQQQRQSMRRSSNSSIGSVASTEIARHMQAFQQQQVRLAAAAAAARTGILHAGGAGGAAAASAAAPNAVQWQLAAMRQRVMASQLGAAARHPLHAGAAGHVSTSPQVQALRAALHRSRFPSPLRPPMTRSVQDIIGSPLAGTPASQADADANATVAQQLRAARQQLLAQHHQHHQHHQPQTLQQRQPQPRQSATPLQQQNASPAGAVSGQQQGVDDAGVASDTDMTSPHANAPTPFPARPARSSSSASLGLAESATTPRATQPARHAMRLHQAAAAVAFPGSGTTPRSTASGGSARGTKRKTAPSEDVPPMHDGAATATPSPASGHTAPSGTRTRTRTRKRSLRIDTGADAGLGGAGGPAAGAASGGTSMLSPLTADMFPGALAPASARGRGQQLADKMLVMSPMSMHGDEATLLSELFSPSPLRSSDAQVFTFDPDQ